MNEEPGTVILPQPAREGRISIESALMARRSVRSFTDAPLSLAAIAQLLWAAQGVTRSGVYRTCPSAGALYPLELQLVAGNVEGMETGAYRYDPGRHGLARTGREDIRRRLAEAAL